MPDSLDLGEPPQPTGAAAPYRVLARKYRPQSFRELIGQDAMVRTLGNAIARDRLAHAFLLTGVRGVGKTSTARLIAKALNCVGPDGAGGPTIDPCGVCEPCRAIAEGRHIDVIEMDAASHTGIDDIREITDAVRYAAVSARYKIYIVDEVHMLSKQAFNGLLKTLEEPPPHVKFLFATTEVAKVPVTVLSRCQRFDLRRIAATALADHFAGVSAAEGVAAEPEALALIARAAEGSARDGLSILDQAIAHAGDGGGDGGGVTAAQVRLMLGLSDRGAVRRLLGLVLAGDPPAVLAALAEQHALGVDPTAVLRGLLETVHAVTRLKSGGAPDPAQSAEERDAIADWADKLSHAMLHRLWQLLLKGLSEVETTVIPAEAAEMALLRIVHAGQMPDPDALVRRLEATGAALPVPSAAPPVPSAAPRAPAAPATFAALVEAISAKEPLLGQRLHDCVHAVRYAPPALAIRVRPGRDDKPLVERGQLEAVLRALFPGEWRVALSDEPGEPTLREQEESAAADADRAIRDHPVVAATFAAFPHAELLDQRR